MDVWTRRPRSAVHALKPIAIVGLCALAGIALVIMWLGYWWCVHLH